MDLLARRRFLLTCAAAVAGEASSGLAAGTATIFLCGDVMTGRGIDQILPSRSAPTLREPYVTDAREYVRLAERVSGRIQRPVPFAYVWGDALAELQRAAPAARVINLETSITRADEYWPGKAIHYRMHPLNVPCLTAARIDVCVLANNHVLDFGRQGLVDTLETLAGAGMKTTGAGRSLPDARQPAIVDLTPTSRLIVHASATESSGVPDDWSAGTDRAGVDLLTDLSPAAADELAARIRRARRGGDVVIASIHWGSNWGYDVPREQIRFAHRLIDGGVDIVHGHSSHHPRPIEVYRRRLILYGCGDLINDYEGIGGYEEYRPDLVLLYFVSVAPGTGELAGLGMMPMQLRRMRLNRASAPDAEWLRDVLDRVSRPHGSRVEGGTDGSLRLRWSA